VYCPPSTTKRPYIGFYQADRPHLLNIIHLHLSNLLSFAMEPAAGVLYLLVFWLSYVDCCVLSLIHHQTAISRLLPGRLTPSFEHNPSLSIQSAVICDGTGRGSSLFACILAELC
jgi:hypothetical protein